MKTFERTLRSAWVLALLLALSGGMVLAQEEGEAEAPPEDEELSSIFPTDPDLDQVDEILETEAMMLEGDYSYDPGSRRDPFKSLLAARERLEAAGERPPGIPGLLIDEIDLTGVFIMPDGPVAQVQSADKEESHLIRVGDQLYDGDVVSIRQNEVAFRQIVDDPTALKPFREVVKKLNP
jgi:hypothetical protein